MESTVLASLTLNVDIYNLHACIEKLFTERGGSVVTHETRIREVLDSNPVDN